MKKVAIVGLLASVEFVAIQGMTVKGNTEQQSDAEHFHNIGWKAPARVQLADGTKLKKDSALIFVPSEDAINNNVNVQFLPMTKEDRKNNNVQVIITVTGALTNAVTIESVLDKTRDRVNVIPNKFNLGSVLVA